MSFKRSTECTWKMGCSLQWWDLLDRGWHLSKDGVPDQFFLSHLHHLNYGGKSHQKSHKGGTLPAGSAGTTGTLQPLPFLHATTERCWFHKWHFSKHSISQPPALCSPAAVPLKPVHWVHVVQVLSLAGLTSRTPWTSRHKAAQFQLCCYFPYHSWHLENSIFRAHWSHFS